jgi:hypothetical protein
MGYTKLSVENFKEAITTPKLMQLRIITFALFVGPMLYAIVAGVLAFNQEKVASQEIAILTYVNFSVGAVAFLCSLIVPGIVIKSKAANVSTDRELIEQAIGKIFAGHLIRFAMVEGAALFGCTCVLLGLGYINYLTFIPLVMALVAHFPSRNELVRQFIVHIRQDERLIVEHLD